MNKFPQYKFPIKLNIGCGNDNRKDYINIDNRDLGFNMVWDIRDGIPFPDSSVESIFSSHLLEHLDDNESKNFLQECLRVVKKNGIVCIRVPHATSSGAIYWGHKTFWNEDKIESTLRLEESIGDFTIVENKLFDNQLLFTFKKN